MDDEFQGRVAVPGFLGLQPALRPLPTFGTQMVGGKTVAAQGEFKSLQRARQPFQGDDRVPQRAGRIFRNAD